MITREAAPTGPSKERSPSFGPVLGLTASGLLAYCILVTLATGDIGFEGDDWWIFSWGYWNTFPKSVWECARESLRPIEGVFWLVAFHLFGFNKVVFHFLSLVLLAATSLLMGLCLMTAFPGRKTVALGAILFSFFLPTLLCLTYVTTTDNSRLSLLLFWCSVWSFQRWAAKSGSWAGLLLPVAFYQLAFLTYEAPSMLIFTVPLLVAPLYASGRSRLLGRAFAVRLAIGVVGSFALAMSLRFAMLNGGAVGHRNLLPLWDLIWGYPALLPFYLAEPLIHISRDHFPLLVGLGAAVWAAWVLFTIRGAMSHESKAWYEGSNRYLALVGLSIFFLGMLPYQMAGYGSVPPELKDTVLLKWGLLPVGNSSWFNFNWSSRIYSAGSFGLAILLGLLFGAWKTETVRKGAAVIAASVIGLYASFHADMISEWQIAAKSRASLCRDLLRQAPAVASGTGFLFLDLDSRYGRAVVFRGWMGMKALLRMLYDDPTLNGWYVFPHAWKWPNFIFQQGFVTGNGFVSRGMKMNSPAPLKSLIMWHRTGDRLKLLESLPAYDGPIQTGISWTGLTSLRSHVERVKNPATLVTGRRLELNKALRRSVCGGACTPPPGK